MKKFNKEQRLIYLSPNGPEIVQYHGYYKANDYHLICWHNGLRLFSCFVGDDELFPLTRSGLQNFVDAEIERRHAAALTDMAQGNPTATHLVRTFEAIAQ